jgi:hypothetical protein
MPEPLAILFGLLFRLGIPIVLTGLAVYFLRQLDNRWKAEAVNSSTAGSALMMAQTPCWERKNCPPERRATCTIYQHQNVLCWQQFRNEGGLLKDDCLECSVFREAPIPVKS